MASVAGGETETQKTVAKAPADNFRSPLSDKMARGPREFADHAIERQFHLICGESVKFQLCGGCYLSELITEAKDFV